MEKGDREKEKGRQAGSWTAREKSRTDWVGTGEMRRGGRGKPHHLCFQSGKQNHITLPSSLHWAPYWGKCCNFLLGVWPFSHFVVCNSLSLKSKSLENEDHSLRLSPSIMGEPECVLQNELKALGGGFICICAGERLELVDRRCSCVGLWASAQMGFCLHPLVPPLQAKGKIVGRFFRHLFTSLS